MFQIRGKKLYSEKKLLQRENFNLEKPNLNLVKIF